MNQTLALDIGGADIIQRLCVDLSQATNLEAGILSVVTTVERSLAPRDCQVALVRAGEPRLLHGGEPMRIPDEAQRTALREGEIVVVPQGEAGMICFAPLRARRALIGWICLIDPTWSPEHESLLRMMPGSQVLLLRCWVILADAMIRQRSCKR